MLLKAMVDKKASDLHVTAGSAPQLRIDGRLVPLRTPALTPDDSRDLCFEILNDSQRHRFEDIRELDFSFGVKNLARFRINLFYQRGAVAGVFRLIPYSVPRIDELGLPKAVVELTRLPRGLVLVTGPTGSGKSTTLAAMIDLINSERHGHIITVEDPIEYVHPHKSCVVSQREVGVDTESFGNALKYILRQDPDVVLIGEMRSLDAIEAGMSLAETGHLTLATLHTNSAIQTINRVIDVFPPHQQGQVRAHLSFVLQAVLSQQLLPKIGGGMVMASELLLPNPAIRNLIREDKVHQIYTQMQVGRSKFAMYTMNQSLYDLVQSRKVRTEDAVQISPEPDELRSMLSGAPPNRPAIT
jgi:twitching motility protein PilT